MTNPKTTEKSNRPPFSEVWSRVVANVNAEFCTKRGHPFRYRLDGRTMFVDRATYRIPMSDLEAAYALVPFSGPGAVNSICRGPSYVWAILHDERVSMGAW